MTHALLAPDRLRQVALSVRKSLALPTLSVVPRTEELPFSEITQGDIVRHCSEDHAVVEIDHEAGWMVLMDERDHCDSVLDCHGTTWHRVAGLF